MLVRRRVMGRRLARAAVGTAVIAGTAGAVHHYQNQKWYGQQNQQAQMQAAYQQGQTDAMQRQQVQQAAPSAPAAPAGKDLSEQLNELAQLHASGVLTDQEFAAAKQKLISGG
jgi:hypothetical protein